MKDLLPVLANPYALHHEILKRQILEAASVGRDTLESAGIELTEGWLHEVLAVPSDCRLHVTRFDVLKHLHEADKLSVYDSESAVTRMQRSDVFFALALVDNNCAHWLFSGLPLTAGWSAAGALEEGLNAAVSAAKSYTFGHSLKTQVTDLDHLDVLLC